MQPVEVGRFFSNKNRKIEDIISDVRIGETCNKLTVLKFDTVDKYHYADDEDNGRLISICPIIYVNGTELHDACFDAYLKHPDYYHLQLKVDVTDSEVIVMPLKFHYQIVFIPHSMIFGNIDFQPVELI